MATDDPRTLVSTDWLPVAVTLRLAGERRDRKASRSGPTGSFWARAS